MNTQLLEKDWELLSAYLDGQLTSREVTDLERRFSTQPELRAALQDLKDTRAVLRATPMRKAPRSFALTPEMVAPRRKPFSWLFPVFSFSSAAAMVLLIISIAIMSGGPKVSPPLAAPVASSMDTAQKAVTGEQAFAAPSPEAAGESVSTPSIITWGIPGGMGMGGGGGAPMMKSSAPQYSAAENAEPMGAAPEPQAPNEAPVAQPTPEGPLVEMAVPTQGQGEETPAPEARAMNDQATGEVNILGLPSMSERGQYIVTPETGGAVVAAEPVSPVSPENGQPAVPTQAPVEPRPVFDLSLIQIGLGLLALLSAVGAFFFWRYSRS